MSKKIAGRTFSTPEDAGISPPTEAELARARKSFDEFQREVDAIAPEDRVKEVSQNFGMTFQALSTTSAEPAET
jgi:hypothetical protein